MIDNTSINEKSVDREPAEAVAAPSIEELFSATTNPAIRDETPHRDTTAHSSALDSYLNLYQGEHIDGKLINDYLQQLHSFWQSTYNSQSPKSRAPTTSGTNILNVRKIKMHNPKEMDAGLTELYKEKLYELRKLYPKKVNKNPSKACGQSPPDLAR